MKLRMAMIAATAAAAAVVPLCTATSASADGYTVRGVFRTYDLCMDAGHAGYNLWGPTFSCGQYNGLWELLAH